MTFWDFAHQHPWWTLIYVLLLFTVLYDVGHAFARAVAQRRAQP